MVDVEEKSSAERKQNAAGSGDSLHQFPCPAARPVLPSLTLQEPPGPRHLPPASTLEAVAPFLFPSSPASARRKVHPSGCE